MRCFSCKSWARLFIANILDGKPDSSCQREHFHPIGHYMGLAFERVCEFIENLQINFYIFKVGSINSLCQIFDLSLSSECQFLRERCWHRLPTLLACCLPNEGVCTEEYAILSTYQHLFSLLSIGADDADALGQGARGITLHLDTANCIG